MANVLMKVSQANMNLLDDYGKESRRIVEEKCSEEIFVDKYIKLIESL